MTSMSSNPTRTDVLLGRGVATNRHPGNENFRAIVSQYLDIYVTSTKKQKMMISKSIVRQVNTQLNPPGRFLEKNTNTGLWYEVDQKRALEKTSQALRDGAAPLRKQLAEDLSYLMCTDRAASVQQPSNQQVSPEDKKRQSPVAGNGIISSFSSVIKNGPQPKKQRYNPVMAREPDVEGLNTIHQDQCKLQHQKQVAYLQTQLFLPDGIQSQSSISSYSSSISFPDNQSGVNTVDTINQQLIQPTQLAASPMNMSGEDQQLAQVLSYTFEQQISELEKKQQLSDSSFMSTPFSMTTGSTPITNYGHANATTAQLMYDEKTLDDEEFAQEMGPDEHFLQLCNPGSMSANGKDSIFDSLDDEIFDD